MNHQQRLQIVSDNETELDKLRAEFHSFREEVRIWQDDSRFWQGVTCGVVAGMCLILGALAMVYAR